MALGFVDGQAGIGADFDPQPLLTLTETEDTAAGIKRHQFVDGSAILIERYEETPPSLVVYYRWCFGTHADWLPADPETCKEAAMAMLFVPDWHLDTPVALRMVDLVDLPTHVLIRSNPAHEDVT